jgi:iron complex outermembrane receptor protein
MGLLMVCSHAVAAQANRTIAGVISDSLTGERLAGVTIGVAGTTTGTVTGSDGSYSLALPPTATTIVVSYVGYLSKNIAASAPDESFSSIRLSPSTRQLDQVLVTAGRGNQEVKRLSVSTEIIKPYLIENKGTVNMERLMDQVPGVNIMDGQANIRGGSGWTFGTGSRVLVMLDDLPYLSGDAGQVAWKFLPVENVEQVEVIKGASSVLYGSSALNGTIHVRTASPTSTPHTGITLLSGFYDQLPRDSSRWTSRTQWQDGMNAFDSRKLGRLDLSTSLNYLNDQGYRWGENDKRGRITIHTNYHTKKPSGLKFGVNISLHDQQSTSFLLWDNFPSGAYIALDTAVTKAHVTNISVDPHADFYVRSTKHRFRGRFLRISNDITTEDATQNQDNTSYTLYGDYQVRSSFIRQLLTVTCGLMVSHTSSDAPLYGGIHTQDNIAPYAQADIAWKRLSMVLGARNETFHLDDAKDNRSIYRAGINYELTSSTFARASYGEGYRYPSIAERYIATRTGSLNIFPNNTLRPETGWNGELGIKQGFKIRNWNGYADVAWFVTEYRDMVEFNFGAWKTFNLFDPLTSIGFKSFNIGRTRISGIDYSVNAYGSIGKVGISLLGGFTQMNSLALDPQAVFATDSLNTAYSYNFTSTDTSRNELKYRYDKLAKMDVEFSYSILSVGMSMRYNSYMKNIDRMFVTPPFSFFTPGVARARELNRDGDFVWDLRSAVTLKKKFRIGLIINNVFNHEMMTRPADMRPPRMYILQLSAKF